MSSLRRPIPRVWRIRPEPTPESSLLPSESDDEDDGNSRGRPLADLAGLSERDRRCLCRLTDVRWSSSSDVDPDSSEALSLIPKPNMRRAVESTGDDERIGEREFERLGDLMMRPILSHVGAEDVY